MKQLSLMEVKKERDEDELMRVIGFEAYMDRAAEEQNKKFSLENWIGGEKNEG